MIRGRISCDIPSLNELHSKYEWIPDETMIRPSPEGIQYKMKLLEWISQKWLSQTNYVLHTIFGVEMKENAEHKCYAIGKPLYEWMFTPSLFRYNVPTISNHYVLWNSRFSFFVDFDDEVINEKISEYLDGLVGKDKYDFAWYKNPKPSVVEFYHVQVFWTSL